MDCERAIAKTKILSRCSISISKIPYFTGAKFKVESFVNLAKPHSATRGSIYFS